MRKLFTIIATMLLWTASMFAQAPQKMAYQAVVRDADGKVITDQELGVQVSILQGTVDGASVYSESHTTTTTSAGAINLEIGGGKSSDDFSAIDWSKGPYFVQSTTEVNGKSVTVTSQLLSVPYALYAEKVNLSSIQSVVDLNLKVYEERLSQLDSAYSKIAEQINEKAIRAMVLQVLADSGYVLGGNGGTTDSYIEGELPGKFSVSATKQVRFSKGNLQYQASTDTWRFAENQYDVIGEDNKNISSTYSGWIDLFGWGTSGYNEKYPYMITKAWWDYGDGENDIAGTDYDWGVYNAISNGGNKAGMWRTLTYDEWNYIINDRADAMNLHSHAVVNGVNGYVFLPDGWVTPSDLTFTPQSGDFKTNVYNKEEWTTMESLGAVFLPCAGARSGTYVYYKSSNEYGDYWSSTYGDTGGDYYAALGFHIYLPSTYFNTDERYEGYSVRLAREITE